MSLPARRLAPLVIPLLLVACTGGGTAVTPRPSAPPSATPSAPPSPSVTVTPSPSARPSPSGSPAAGVIVEFLVVGKERYRVHLTDPKDIANARELLAGKEAPAIPNGKVLRGVTGVNTGHDWSIDPEDFDWADMTIELCDGIPSQLDDRSFEADRFCPWAAKVVRVEPYRA